MPDYPHLHRDTLVAQVDMLAAALTECQHTASFQEMHETAESALLLLAVSRGAAAGIRGLTAPVLPAQGTLHAFLIGWDAHDVGEAPHSGGTEQQPESEG